MELLSVKQQGSPEERCCVNLGQVTHFQIQTFLRVGVFIPKILFCLVAENGANHKVWFQIMIQMAQIWWKELGTRAFFFLFFPFLFVLFCFVLGSDSCLV